MDTSRLSAENALRQIEIIEEYLRIPLASRMDGDQRQMKVVLILNSYPETSNAHLAWAVAQWMERPSGEFAKFPSWAEILSPLYKRTSSGMPVRGWGYSDSLPPFLKPAMWQLQEIARASDAPGAPPGAEDPGAYGPPPARPLLPAAPGAPIWADGNDPASFFQSNPGHPAAHLYYGVVQQEARPRGLSLGRWEAYLADVDQGRGALVVPDGSGFKLLATAIRCQEWLERGLLSGATSVRDWNACIPSDAVVLPRPEFLRQNPRFRDMTFRAPLPRTIRRSDAARERAKR